MFESLAQALAAGLSLWDHKERHKYQDKLMELQLAYYEEDNKDPTDRDDAKLDCIEFELRVLAGGFSSAVRESHAKD